MKPYILHHGNNLEVLRSMPDNSVDSIVTDPPYGLSFMGKKWDYDVPSVELWAECLRVLKPGGHLLAFAGTRTQHRMAVRIEDAGFEIRDMIAWVYGSGFPKSLDVSKAIDKAAGAEREVVGPNPNSRPNMVRVDAAVLSPRVDAPLTAPATEAARQWQGWGSALKPSLEPVTVARKPFDTTVAENVLTHGTGAINIDGCRVATDELKGKIYNNNNTGWKCTSAPSTVHGHETGRWPANLIHDGSEEVVAGFPVTTQPSARPNSLGVVYGKDGAQVYGKYAPNGHNSMHTDSGSAARFFYCAKASKADRDEGCGDVEPQQRDESRKQGDPGGDNPRNRGAQPRVNCHPTVKPTDLMRYLCRLVTPPGGLVLDPFMGSGSTGKAAILEGFRFIGIEREAEYVAIAERRIGAVCEVEKLEGGEKQMTLFGAQ